MNQPMVAPMAGRAGQPWLIPASIAGVLAVGLLIEVASGRRSAPYGLLIATAALIRKRFGNKCDAADQDVQGSHATTRALFQAADTAWLRRP